ncbi:MAG TPA: four helix bundle protein [Gemmatimonadaceae bacterium]|nr:four helix bundle protein [Gemmatimonadaceae bacterium]
MFSPCNPFAGSKFGRRRRTCRSLFTVRVFHHPFGGAPGLRSQLLRAVNAIADDIAEGAGQRSRRQFVRFLEIALASAHEVDSQPERAIALGVFDPVEGRRLQERTWEVKRMLTAFHRTVKRRADEEDEGPCA